ncbi:asparagine synthase-related protein [Ruania zhangjianzhongii]|uniref:asparagine synthase-related protein n=1 Tax=Ruania zhangjianzhongii TaxID=2603206 RepID=UPI001F340852|nr:ATP-dependent sacrificial sulfur transferase LarE [Ruania zhangjianzhongii]
MVATGSSTLAEALTGLGPEAAAVAARARETMAGAGRLGVAFSGGVDSAVLLALAVAELGDQDVLAILGISPSLAADERAAAHEVAAFIGARVVEVATHEEESAGYRANDVDRCFFCKDELFTRISDEVVTAHGLVSVAYGENADDAARPDRPGAQAATNHRVLRPLADAGATKELVREIARAMALPCADKPAAPCLASRIPHHQEVTPAKLQQVEQVEAGLRRLGFSDSRVRHHGEIARIELPPGEIERAAGPQLRTAIHRLATDAGFGFATVDLRGIQSGAFTLSILNAGRTGPPGTAVPRPVP